MAFDRVGAMGSLSAERISDLRNFAFVGLPEGDSVRKNEKPVSASVEILIEVQLLLLVFQPT